MKKAADLIRVGGLVAFPTETVYGLGANANNGEAVARIFEAKGRPHFNPLIVHVASLADAERLAHFDDAARKLSDAFWPGPLTLVLPRQPDTGLSDLVSAGLPTVALRIPSNDVALELLVKAGVPIAAPSANKSGHVSATTAAHVAADLGVSVDMILDGGPCVEGVESTIVGLSEGAPVLLRAGAIPRTDIEAVLGRALIRSTSSQEAPQAPGMLTSHYAPRAQLRLNVTSPEVDEPFLGFGSVATNGKHSLNLSAAGDLREAAAHLFAYLRTLDATGSKTIAVAPIPEIGLGEAINDRLRRAATPRG